MSSRTAPSSCDTFVVLPGKTKGNHVVFGKNSDRPAGEVQEINYIAAQDHSEGSKVQCTYISIDQVPHTYGVILSKPAWMWGAEMGSNECGVCIGNEAVWTKLNDDETDKKEKLLGMDLVRLGLERSSTADEAVDVITSLLETHGQGGPCSDTDTELLYHNSFLIADPNGAWILETAGNHWAAEHVTDGCRNISNALSIGTKIDKMSDGMKEKAQSEGWWDGTSDFNFAEVYGDSAVSDFRKERGEKLLTSLSEDCSFDQRSMFQVLRNKMSGICMTGGGYCTTGSQVSVLVKPDVGRPSCHWFTGTPDPSCSVFKPFIFTDNVKISPFIQSPIFPDDEDPAKMTPRFSSVVDRSHLLYRRHQAALANGWTNADTLKELESKCVEETEAYLQNFDPSRISEVDDLFKDVVESELKFYK
ncbi:secernin-2 isoform X2 [Oratosquilla oratoria]|uniref:secernin-2 isoform X2 n=1 Tax=Oratosquilla oratoria TaxID=337810 RepID=UPI003F75E923